MKNLIELLKRNGVEIACGAGAVLGIALIFLGLGRMGDVQTELEGAHRVKNDIAGIGRGEIINRRAVEQSAKLIADVQSGFQRVMTYVRERNAYPPLVPDAFPGGTSKDIGNAMAFRNAFGRLRDAWLAELKAGTEPSAAEIAAEKDRMTAQQTPADSRQVGARRDEEEKKVDTGLTPEQGAAIKNAQEIYCYATIDSFQVSDVSRPGGPMDEGPPPTLQEMWYAQLETWVQQSVVSAIAAINAQAAAELEKEGVAPWVGNLPIKDLRSLQTTRYYVKEGLDQVRDATGQSSKDRVFPSGTPAEVFTERQSNELYELMQFSLQIVVDARHLPAVVANLGAHRFHVPLRVQYETIPPNPSMTGKIYGDAPVVLLTADFETVFFSDIYLPLMPEQVLTLLGKTRPEPPAEQGV